MLEGTKVERVVIVNGSDAGSDVIPESAFVDGEPNELPPADTGPGTWRSGCTRPARPGVPRASSTCTTTWRTRSGPTARTCCASAADDRCFSVPKIFFAYGFGNSLTFPFSVGATTVLMPGRPEAGAVLDVVERFRPTVLFGLPTLYTALCNAEGSAIAISARCACRFQPRRCFRRRSTPAGRRSRATVPPKGSARPRCCTSTCRIASTITASARPAPPCRGTR